MKKQSKAAKIRVLLAEGMSVKDIAKKMKIAEPYVAQVKWHWKKRATQKAETKAEVQAVASKLFDKEYDTYAARQKAKSDKAYNEYRSRVDLNALDTTDSASYWGRLPAPDTDPNSKSALGFLNEILARRAEDEADLVEQTDNVNHPSHYKVGGIETIDFIEAKGLGYNLGNVVKYVSRAGYKHGNLVQDLKKARWYLDREIANLESAGF